MYYVDKHFLGFDRHVVPTSGEINFVEQVQDGWLVEDGTSRPGTVQSFLQLLGSSLPLTPDNISLSCAECKIPPQLTGLSYLLRRKELADILTRYHDRLVVELDPLLDYMEFYTKNVRTLNACSRMRFSKPMSNLELDENGFVEQVVYDTTTTKTGRMSVISGPNVLTMQKDFKSFLESRFEGGKIVEIDYSALEPRVALAVVNNSIASEPDVYSKIGEIIGVPDRSVVKQFLISFLYGAGMSTIQRLVELPATEIKPKLEKLNSLFKQKVVVDAIREQVKTKGCFRNHAGRLVFPSSDRAGLLFNNYCQSSAVDVALSGFSDFLEELCAEGLNAVPLCFIHDAILLDVPHDEIEPLRDISSTLTTYLGLEFPTKLTVINN